jgi:hypothetical protein
MLKAQYEMIFLSTDRVYLHNFPINIEKTMNKKDIENRLINLSVEISEWIIQLRKHPTVMHL